MKSRSWLWLVPCVLAFVLVAATWWRTDAVPSTVDEETVPSLHNFHRTDLVCLECHPAPSETVDHFCTACGHTHVWVIVSDACPPPPALVTFDTPASFVF